MDEMQSNTSCGRLFVVATPIGNVNDITLRALQVLADVDLIAAEDTRSAGRLLAAHKIKNRLISCHEHNEDERIDEMIDVLMSGRSIAIISEAGTPTISDPGFRLIRAALEKNIRVVPIPGVSAAITALSASGLPTDSFLFVGFLAKRKKRRYEQLNSLRDCRQTIVIYESPKRILTLIDEIISLFGNRYAILARELTKKHEEFLRDTLLGIAQGLKQKKAIKGECTLLLSGNAEVQEADAQNRLHIETLQAEIGLGITAGIKPSELAKKLAATYNIKKNIVYAEILKKKQLSSS